MGLTELLELSRPPDSEPVDLIERAFLEGQIDGSRADLAYSWLLMQKAPNGAFCILPVERVLCGACSPAILARIPYRRFELTTRAAASHKLTLLR
jgi:hypothetical protein